MSRVNADTLRELLIYLMIENAQARAAASPVVHSAFIDVDNLGPEFDQALDEVNGFRREQKASPLEVDATFKQAVLDTFMKRMEQQGRVMMRS